MGTRRKPKRLSRALVAQLRARAPKHPAGPEQQIKHAIVQLFTLLQHDIRHRIRLISPRVAQKVRKDAAEPSAIKTALEHARTYGKHLVNGPVFHALVWGAAIQTAFQAAKQVKAALDKKRTVDLKSQAQELSQRIIDRTGELVDDSIRRAQDVTDIWLDLDPDYSDRAGDPDALDEMIAEDQDSNTGKALALAALAFGAGFAAMSRMAQEDSGASKYMWLSQKDSHVRPAHRDLDEDIADWDHPPLKASESDNEEDDHPGEDYNCRCVASPLTPEDESELGLD